MVLCKHIQSLPSTSQFFGVGVDEPPQRVDDGRVALIVLTKLLEYLQFAKVDPENVANEGELTKFRDMAEQLVLIMVQYFIDPVIGQRDQAIQS